MIAPTTRRFWSEKAQRVVMMPTGELAAAQPILLRAIAKNVKLHPNHYGVGRPNHELIYRLMEEQAKDAFIGVADISKAFQNASKRTLHRELAEAGIPKSILPLLGLKKVQFVGPNQKPHRGIPQGFNTSSIVFALYMDQVLRRLNNGRYKVFLYADNLFWAAPSYQKAKKARNYIAKALRARGLLLHKIGNKAATISRPDQPFKALGFTINMKANKR